MAKVTQLLSWHTFASHLSFSVEWVFVFSPKFICWHSNSQRGGIWRWGIWVVIRVRWIYEGGALLVRLAPYKKRHQRAHTVSTHMSWGKDPWPQGESPPQNLTRPAPWPQTSSLQNGEKRSLYCFKPSNLWYFVLYFSIKHPVSFGTKWHTWKWGWC